MNPPPTLPRLLLVACLATVAQAALPDVKPTASTTPAPVLHTSFRRPHHLPSYLRENFGLLPAAPKTTATLPPQATREEAFALRLKSLRDNRMESSRMRANRLVGSAHPVENEALTFLGQALGGANASNPVARSVQRHLSTEAGRQELLVSLGFTQTKKFR